MNSFKEAALKVLEEAGEPLHVREITRRALDGGLLQTAGKTPIATMGARLQTDVNKLGDKSRFLKVGPATFAKNPVIYKFIEDTVTVNESVETKLIKSINQSVSSKQKGDIAEARITELVTLFGDQALSCYRPVSDDEGIDLIVKQKGGLKTLYLQIKSRWQDKTGPMIAEVKKKGVMENYAMGIVICLYDIEEADIWDYVWFIPAPDFLKHAVLRKDGETLRFTSSKNLERMGVWADYLIPKQDLANKLIEHMKRI
jgi:hypothetical protein